MSVSKKELLDAACELCDRLGEMANLNENIGLDKEIKMSSILKMDLFSFLAYLAASDNVISWKESRYIGDLLGLSMSPETLNNLIIERNIYSTEFEEKPPLTLQLFVAMDNAIYDSNASSIDDELGRYLLKLYMAVGIGLVESNGESVEDEHFAEKEDFEIYMNMLRRYAEENTKRHHTDIIFNHSKTGKQKEKKDTEINNGAVKAPKKKL